MDAGGLTGRGKAQGSQAFVGSAHKRLPTDEKERRILELKKENLELKRANEIPKDALGFSPRAEGNSGESGFHMPYVLHPARHVPNGE